MIRVLDELTINKIAAGEVVEGPFSVVKELVENAIDAKSDSIILEIKEGGKKYIRITDNGVGIPETEVETAFLRHATSKITKLEDLESIYSLGFRGEALASIASVSQVEIITKPKDQPYGISMEIAGGKVLNKKQVGCPTGTTIIVKNMFFNTPARMKFMKSTGGETSKISEIITRLALSKPHVAFKYINNNNIMFTTAGNNDLSQVILSVLDRTTYKSLIPVRSQLNVLTIEGFISQPSYARGNRSYEIVFINGRYVKNKLIFQAIENAYKERLPINKYPVCILSVDLDPKTIDVNVHPTKTEVKFHDEEGVYQAVYRTISEILTKRMLIPKLGITERIVEKATKIEEVEVGNQDKTSNKINVELTPSSIEVKPTPSSIEVKPIPATIESSESSIEVVSPKSISAKETPNESLQQKFENKASYITDNKINNKTSNLKAYSPPKETTIPQSLLEQLVMEEEKTAMPITVNEVEEIQETFLSSLLTNQKVIGQLFNTYILIEKDASMYLIDQHAAHERLVYNRIMREFQEEKVVIQQLLNPQVIELSTEDYGVLTQHITNFNAIGFEIEDFGQNTVIIRGVPLVLGIPREYNFLLETIDELKNGYNRQVPFQEKLIQKACKEAIKGKEHLNTKEIENLLMELKQLEPPLTCPHGRPIVLSLSKYEIEKYFKRIQ